MGDGIRKEVDSMKDQQLKELILQSLEHERGGVKIYHAAVAAALNEDLHREWQKYLVETTTHVRILEEVCAAFGLDPEMETPGRMITRGVGTALVQAINAAIQAGDPEAAQIVASECVVLAETKDHLDWELLGRCGEKMTGPKADALNKAAAQVEDQEDEHLYHTKGWCRELWLRALGLPAVLPPPEEVEHVKTAIAAAKAEQSSLQSR
jgi:rubrerythrin